MEETSAGTGIVLSEDGLILTNFHVISGATRVRVILPTGESRDASFVADDSPFHDMALLSIPAGGLKAAALGSSSSLRLGEPLLAVASGVNTVQNQVKAGVVSALDVDLVRPGLILTGMIQTDAAVNHGDSGGALVNANGEVVGILTTIVREQPSGDIVEGVALCHAIDGLRPVIDAVRALGSNPRPRLGIERYSTQHRLLTADEAARLRLRPNDGVVVMRVEPGSPAEAAGIRVGDIILAVGGQRLSQSEPFVNLIGAAGGNEVRLTVVRDGAVRQIPVTPRPVRGS
ncbi:MAG: PDZ domain-containing protein [Dehalococcoidia bacterium]|nr:MAG: PDZ domain-containing protein [Dehalococcoidia bacterium]